MSNEYYTALAFPPPQNRRAYRRAPVETSGLARKTDGAQEGAV